MCGIVASVSTRNIVPILVQGLQRLEYRGYDSCGVAVYNGGLKRARSTSRVAELQEQVANDKLEGATGIAHTRWATHGAPVVHNAHPHFSHGSGAASQAKPGKAVNVQVALPEEVPGAFFAPATWRAPAPLNAHSSRDSFGERRRE